MEKDERNRGSLFNASGENKDKNERHLQEDNDLPTKGDPDGGTMDLDGDGMIGETGGFYGGTTYLGSNFSEGLNAAPTEEAGNQAHSDTDRGAAQEGDAPRTTDQQEEQRSRLSKDDSFI